MSRVRAPDIDPGVARTRPNAGRPVETAFVGVLALPRRFVAGRRGARHLAIPAYDADEPVALGWSRAIAFAPLSPASETGHPNRFVRLVEEALGPEWLVEEGRIEECAVRLSSPERRLRIRLPICPPVVRLVGGRRWDFAQEATAEDRLRVLEVIAVHAIAHGIPHRGALACADGTARELDGAALHGAWSPLATAVTSFEAFDAWRRDVSRALYVALQQVLHAQSPAMALGRWARLGAEARGAWTAWVRRHPGLLRLEVAVRGYFENGGRVARVALAAHVPGAEGPPPAEFLGGAFDGVAGLAAICAPGLGRAWQQAILDYAGPAGRDDLLAVLDTPRYLLTRAPVGVRVGEEGRWTEGLGPYEAGTLQSHGAFDLAELRFPGDATDGVLARAVPRDDAGRGAAYGPWVIVDNPVSVGSFDRYLVVPPSGHVAGMLAAARRSPESESWKPPNTLLAGVRGLVTDVSDAEQRPLVERGINVIRRMPVGGIRVRGTRTVSRDARWADLDARQLRPTFRLPRPPASGHHALHDDEDGAA